MSYEARCILQLMKDMLELYSDPRKSDWIELANEIAAGEHLRRARDTVIVTREMRSVP